jgi:CRP-like cAMP-binding protein
VANRIVNMVDGRIVSDVDVAETWETLQLLQNVPLLKDITVAVLKEIAGQLGHETHPAGTTIFRAGEPGEKFYIVRSGFVKVVLSQGTRPGQELKLGPSQFFGELALFYDRPRAATITATEEVELLTLTRSQFLALMKEAPTVEQQMRKLYFAG